MEGIINKNKLAPIGFFLMAQIFLIATLSKNIWYMPVAIACLLIGFIAVLKKPSFLIYLTVIELAVGGAGRFIEFGKLLSIRYILFLSCIVLYFLYIISVKKFKIHKSPFYLPVLVFIGIVAFGIYTGLVKGRMLSDIYSSTSGYLYFIFLPIFVEFIDSKTKVIRILSIFRIFAVLLGILSILIFALMLLDPLKVYNLLNPLLLGKMLGFLDISRGNIPRVFFKTSVFFPIFFVTTFIEFILVKESNKLKLILYMVILSIATITTMTMGFWLAMAIGTAMCLLLLERKKLVRIIGLFTVISVPILFLFRRLIIQTIVNRLSSDDVSMIVKKDQFNVLMNMWENHFFIGNGFGTVVKFEVAGMVRVMNHFEIFWLELTVLAGLIGLLAYGYIIFSIIRVSLKINANSLDSKSKSTIFGLTVGVIMLCIITSFNPFLNNPIGIGYLILAMAALTVFYKEHKRKIHKI